MTAFTIQCLAWMTFGLLCLFWVLVRLSLRRKGEIEREHMDNVMLRVETHERRDDG